MPLPKAPRRKGDRLDDAVELSAGQLAVVKKKAVEAARKAEEAALAARTPMKKEKPQASSPVCGRAARIEETPCVPPAPTCARAAEDFKRPSAERSASKRGRALTDPSKKKLFVLDTNVLMHDPTSIFRFAEHDVFIPMTTLEELDRNKKGLSDVARNVRSVSRTLDSLIELSPEGVEGGIPLNLLGSSEALGRLYFETHSCADKIFEEDKGDNLILESTAGLAKIFPDHAAVLVTKDINMRIKASALGIPVEDYFNDKVLEDSDLLYTGFVELPADFWEKAKDFSIRTERENTYYTFELENASEFIVNMCASIKDDDSFFGIVTRVEDRHVTFRILRSYLEGASSVMGIHAKNKEQNFALNLLLDPEIDFVSILGPAGTGKTLLTLAAALSQIVESGRYAEAVVTRTTVTLGEDIGFLPGTEEEKMEPWMGAFSDNLEVIAAHSGLPAREKAKLSDKISIKSLNFMRGRTFIRKFLILDEAQNLSPKQIKALITRAGPGTKVVCLGNLSQIDTPYLTEGSSGLAYVVDRFAGWRHAASITLTQGERSRLAVFANDVL